MLVAGVVRHQVDDDAQVMVVRVRQQAVEGGQVAEDGFDLDVVGDVVAVVVHRRGIERREPQRIDAEVDEVVQV